MAAAAAAAAAAGRHIVLLRSGAVSGGVYGDECLSCSFFVFLREFGLTQHCTRVAGRTCHYESERFGF